MIDDDDIMPPNTLDNDVEVVEPDAVELENLLLDEGELENLLLDDVELENLLLDDDTSILPNTIDDSSEVVEPVRKKNVITVVRSNNCPLCDFESENSKALSDHIKTKHKLTQTSMLRCGDCNLIFINGRKLKDHIEVHHRDHPMEVLEPDVEVDDSASEAEAGPTHEHVRDEVVLV